MFFEEVAVAAVVVVLLLAAVVGCEWYGCWGRKERGGLMGGE